jgi:hypothetical protein
LFAVAYKRFIDNVPSAIDEAFVRGVAIGLQAVTLSKLGIDGPHGYANCIKLLQEPKHVERQRIELRSKLVRLEGARREFQSFTAVYDYIGGMR